MTTLMDDETMGPVEYAVFEFQGNRFNGKILPELQALVEAGTVRIIDLVIVKKDLDGSGVVLELNDLEPEESELFNGLDGEVGELMSDEDLAAIMDELEPNTTAALLVWENAWAKRLASAVREANGRVVMHERVPTEVIDLVLEEAMAE